jgi:hypothetical protein
MRGRDESNVHFFSGSVAWRCGVCLVFVVLKWYPSLVWQCLLQDELDLGRLIVDVLFAPILPRLQVF